MTAREGRRPAKISRPSLVLAMGSSAAVAAAAVTGHRPTAPEVAGGFAVAGAIAALNLRGRPLARPHVLSALPEPANTSVVIAAQRARSMAAHPAGHSDAA